MRTTESFIIDANKIHNFKYDYSKTQYKGCKEKVCIICLEHGEFWQTPDSHLHGCGCPKCSGKSRLTQEEFIKRSKEIHDNRYNYSKVNYISRKKKVIIICPIHGEFQQTPDNHLQGKGCPKCANKNITTEDWIDKAKFIHGDKYNYSKVEYKKGHDKVIINCPIHGDFKQQATSHLQGFGCPKCRNEKLREERSQSTEEFITLANKKHNMYYDYSKVKYINEKTKIIIICPKHGEFLQTPESHLRGNGCPKCNKFCVESKGENFVFEFLKNNKFNVIRQYGINIDTNINPSGNAYIDFYLPDHNIFIEYNGVQHYKNSKYFKGYNFNRQQARDQFVKQYCLNNNILLIEIKYTLTQEEIVKLLSNYLLKEYES